MSEQEEKRFQVELDTFAKTSLYKHLLKLRQERLRIKLSRLIDVGLKSDDLQVNRIAQSIEEETVFWQKISSIKETVNMEQTSGERLVEKAFRDYSTPNADVEVSLMPTGGFV